MHKEEGLPFCCAIEIGSSSNNLAFFKENAAVPSTIELGGFNTSIARMQGHALMPSTKAVYTLLMDMAPANPTTMMTDMLKPRCSQKKLDKSTPYLQLISNSTIL